MKAFNKLFSLVVASVLVFSLAGCGDKEESKKFSANLNGTEIAITYVYKGDKVLKQFLKPNSICLHWCNHQRRCCQGT
ncbi:lipoprotein yehR [Escherichia coli]|uniref:Lipoprotein yehR n=1 Tax=Escherichia coli TaxID=562 RepID=A0A2X1P2M2_ECOLX|nr:lipoprotein yehR [Escherichia coli]